MTLRNAIADLEICLNPAMGNMGAIGRNNLRIVLAAARAFACETCGGTGEVDAGSVDDTYPAGKSWVGCPKCREDRAIATSD